VVEEHPDGFVSYPLGVEGAVIGDGETAEDALTSAKAALAAHIEAFGPEVLPAAEPVIDASIVASEIAS
jgi:predicted RNase H-like HicB family nuclease